MIWWPPAWRKTTIGSPSFGFPWCSRKKSVHRLREHLWVTASSLFNFLFPVNKVKLGVGGLFVPACLVWEEHAIFCAFAGNREVCHRLLFPETSISSDVLLLDKWQFCRALHLSIFNERLILLRFSWRRGVKCRLHLADMCYIVYSIRHQTHLFATTAEMIVTLLEILRKQM